MDEGRLDEEPEKPHFLMLQQPRALAALASTFGYGSIPIDTFLGG